jgi:hypothetical protein
LELCCGGLIGGNDVVELDYVVADIGGNDLVWLDWYCGGFSGAMMFLPWAISPASPYSTDLINGDSFWIFPGCA